MEYTIVVLCEHCNHPLTYTQGIGKEGVRLFVHECEECKRRSAEDICGLCGLPGADKMASPNHWPGERVPETELVHQACEEAECGRAHAALSDKQREAFLRTM